MKTISEYDLSMKKTIGHNNTNSLLQKIKMRNGLKTTYHTAMTKKVIKSI